MFLKRLVVKSLNLGIIRDITFHKGVNLIIDRSVKKRTETGNSVGKTTALRAIDFCLGAKQDGFYIDPEFKTEDTLIKDYLINNEVTFDLEVVNLNGKVTKISRKAMSGSKTYAVIDEEVFTNLKSFHDSLKSLLFMNSSSKPSFRQIITRFIRSSSDKMSNALRTLTMASNADYETLNLFLFGFNDASVLSEKQHIVKLLKKTEKEYDVLLKIRSKNALEQSLAVIVRDIENKERDAEEFKLSDSYSSQIIELNEIRGEISNLSQYLSSLEMKRMLNNKAIDNLVTQQDKTDPNELKKLYVEATERIGQLSKTFEMALNFHNKMLIKKTDFIKSQMSYLAKSIDNTRAELTSWLEKESYILKELSKLGSLNDLQIIHKELNKLYESKGDFESSLMQIKEFESRIESLQMKLQVISTEIEKEINNFNDNLSTFNKYFSEYTRELYNDEFILAYEVHKENYVFKLEPLGAIQTKGNQGDGKKKAQVTALDLAYLSSLEEKRAKTLRFVAHDGIEAIHANQIKTLFDIAAGIDGQYILAILQDKLSSVDNGFIEDNTVLKLSESNKFFKI
ncbi:DUF2326 domain-containing protein [Chimaeribacter californicus]|uniref:DUF2326 domain-containing protein n=1 Tax=Chimaeribacter californicus TaxID=2060067 RepID=A0A2N5E2Y8_9GAMM|nr:DUF2326 domain-containing protein [Chimaeribacter californicus]PLR35051.1 DUF2326 domain-containing protein [Chimaeribacter californicus]